jgi:hypothetical protein
MISLSLNSKVYQGKKTRMKHTQKTTATTKTTKDVLHELSKKY